MSGWSETAQVHDLSGGRFRLTHGPIDVVASLDGPRSAVAAARSRIETAFAPVLARLAAELPRLRATDGPDPEGPLARRMCRATAAFAPAFVTPMAAVAGAVADHLLGAALTGPHGLRSAHLNNGGDIAVWQRDGALRLAVCDDPARRISGARAEIAASAGIGGVATSGWRGRSFSLGIADAVTVLAKDAATADAAATLIANAVDLPGHLAIARRPARDLAPDSDLGNRRVTVAVGPLDRSETRRALDRGLALARDYHARGLIHAACLALQSQRCIVGNTITLPEPAHA
ncbi:UPF0280 family protein [Sulfitobacter sp. D35]|uniref:UPF0280 family protein n=1 Tax=Sulfitobacter sp. D35 TaxID=3083252 RepID=UPI00296FB0B6|nr:UPF0280 family protein [Sulfitobacter sp. D35]MDW4498519.1 UPF0280 family protein [Sulfitobacter sp. D35]